MKPTYLENTDYTDLDGTNVMPLDKLLAVVAGSQSQNPEAWPTMDEFYAASDHLVNGLRLLPILENHILEQMNDDTGKIHLWLDDHFELPGYYLISCDDDGEQAWRLMNPVGQPTPIICSSAEDPFQMHYKLWLERGEA